jgi:type I restriction enzyme S subunit
MDEKWRELRLREVITLKRGYDLRTADRNQSGTVPVVSSSGITGSHDEAKVQPPGVVTGRYGTVGKVFYLIEPFWPLNTTLYVRDFKGNDPYFIYYFLHIINFERFSDKTGVPGVDRNDLHRIRVSIPPLPEQRKIAVILSTWDQAIALTDRRIEAARQRKKGLMQRLLTGRVRFPEFVITDGYSSALRGLVPKDWRILEFGDFASKSSKKFDPKKETGIHECIELEHISQETGQILGTTSTEEQKSVKNSFSAGQVLFGKLRPYLKKFTQPDFSGVCSSEIWVLSGKKDLCSNDFLFYLVQSERFLAAANVTSGTKMPRSDWGYVSEFAFAIPLLQEQCRIAAVLQACDREIELLTQKRDALQRQKKGLMQRLLTGRVRVKV